MTAPAPTTFLDPAVLARIGSLELVARTVVEGFLTGLHRSPRLGASTDFAEHRGYMPGDDIRRVDWRLWARTDRFYVKEFEADTNTNVTVILDVSRSMAYGTRTPSKLDYGRYLAASLLHFCQGQRDRVGFAAIDDAVRAYVPPSARHLPLSLLTIDRLAPGGAGELDAPLRALGEHVRRRCVVVLISDFYEPPSRVADAIAHLRGRGNDIIAFHLLDPAELDFPFEGAASFEDLETGARLPVVTEQLRERYRTAIRAHIDALAELLGSSGVDYTMLSTATPLDAALFDFLTRRQRFLRVR